MDFSIQLTQKTAFEQHAQTQPKAQKKLENAILSRKFYPEKILIISPAWLGDIVIAQALFKYIKQTDVTTTIDVMAPRWSHGLLATMPEISEIIDMPLGHHQFKFKKRWQLGKILRKKNYQRAIVLPNSWKSAIIPLAAQIPLRTGWYGELRFGLLNNWKVLDKEKYPLMVQRFLALGSSPISDKTICWELYKPSLKVDLKQVSKTLNKFAISTSEKPLLILCPGAAFGPAKRWPVEHFAEVARAKQAEGWQVCLLGAHNDQAHANKIQGLTAETCINLTAKTSLAEAIDVLSSAALVISNDSGLMHVAAALQRPLIALYGSSSPEFTPPLTQYKCILTLNLSCSPCFQRECPLVHFNCLKQLMPKQVLAAIDELIG